MDVAIIRRKLARIAASLDVLRPIGQLSVEEFGERSYERNRLVHAYETIEDAKVLGSVGTLLDLHPRYIQAVEAYLTKAVCGRLSRPPSAL